VPDDALGRPTAIKQPVDGASAVDGSRLGDDWRERIPADLRRLADAWADPSSWEGNTAAGGVELPAAVAGRVTLGELCFHAWDVAVATGQSAPHPSPEEVEVLLGLAQQFGGIEGVFGPAVALPDDAPAFERVLGLAGRDPSWRPPAQSASAAAS
jgi:uncharacterized protein (TIGR03086 family)